MTQFGNQIPLSIIQVLSCRVINILYFHLPMSVFFFHQDSEESEDEDGLTEEDLKQSEGHESLINCIRIMAQKQSV